MGWSFRDLRYAVTKSLQDSVVCGIDGMRLKLGNNSAVVVFGVSLDGSDEAVMRTLLNGCKHK